MSLAKKVKSGLERVLDKNLQDLVRGIRTHKNNEAKFISECLEEIKQELRQENVAVKANAIAKLTYLQMLGYDISWAAFNIIEVMSSPKFTYKRVAYLAASQCFHKDLDVLMLSTNLLRKDLNSHNAHDAGLAITSLSCFITPDLARDLGNDIVTLMNSTKPYIRKKAVLLTYKVFLNHPDFLRSAFPRLREKLEDPDPGVQSAAVHVICELARRNPQNYLPLAPTFFKLMTSSVNNWVLIKIIKLFGALTPIEPRLGKKLLEPLTNLIHSTSAMSLLYECIQTVIAVLLSITARPPAGLEDGGDSPPPEHASAIQLCVQKLRVLIEDADQNLKYLGLLAMSKILEAHPKPVQAHKDLILACLDDRDESIRLRALDLLHGMVSRKNLVEISRKLIAHAEKAEGSHYRDEIVAKVIGICSQSNYQYVTNFEWYISVLVELARLQGMKRGQAIAAQILDVAIRVAAVRPYAVQQMAIILQNSQMFYSQGALLPNGPCEVLYAAAWICGEFSSHLPQPAETLDALLMPRAAQLPQHIQAVYLQNAAKIYARLLRQLIEEANVTEDGEFAIEGDDDSQNPIRQLNDRIRKSLAADFLQSADLEVQERASCFHALIDFIEAAKQNGYARKLAVVTDLVALFDGELNPVAPKAQRKVPVPEGLDLDKWINEPPPEDISPASSGEAEANAFNLGPMSPSNAGKQRSETSSPAIQLSPEELQRRRDQRLAEQQSNPHYLKTSSKSSKAQDSDSPSLPRVTQLQGMTRSLIVANQPESSEGTLLRTSNAGGAGSGSMLEQSGQYETNFSSPTSPSKKGKKTKKGAKGKKAAATEEEDDVVESRANIVVSTAFDMPEGASLSDGEGKDPYRGRPATDEDMYRRLGEIRLDNNLPPVASNGKHIPTSTSTQGLKITTKEPEPVAEVATQKEKKKKKSADGDSKTKKKTGTKKSKKAVAEVVEAAVEEPKVEEQPPVKAKEVTDDLDFWLAPSAASQPSPPAPEPASEHAAPTNGKKSPGGTTPRKTPKKSSSKVSSKKQKDGAVTSPTPGVRDDLAAVLGSPCPAPDRSEYEEADSGSVTPGGMGESSSADQIASLSLAVPTGFTTLAENSLIRLGYQARPDESDNKHVVVSACLQNLSSSLQIKEFELTILDAQGGALSLLRSKKQPEGVIKLPASVSSGQQGAGSFTLVVGEGALSSPTLPRMRGTLSYMAKASDGSSVARQDQLEFRFTLPASAFVYAEPYSTADSLQQLMSSGLLTERESSTATIKAGVSLDAIASRVASELHLTIVERPSGAASTPTAVALHGRTINGDHLCVLLKQQPQQLSLDVRASQAAKPFLSVFVAQVVDVISSKC